MSKKDVRPYFSYTRSQRRMKVKITALSLACQQKYQDFNLNPASSYVDLRFWSPECIVVEEIP
jgi:hypothetical protein